jgi:hypothetical protein
VRIVTDVDVVVNGVGNEVALLGNIAPRGLTLVEKERIRDDDRNLC